MANRANEVWSDLLIYELQQLTIFSLSFSRSFLLSLLFNFPRKCLQWEERTMIRILLLFFNHSHFPPILAHRYPFSFSFLSITQLVQLCSLPRSEASSLREEKFFNTFFYRLILCQTKRKIHQKFFLWLKSRETSKKINKLWCLKKWIKISSAISKVFAQLKNLWPSLILFKREKKTCEKALSNLTFPLFLCQITPPPFFLWAATITTKWSSFLWKP